jgi:hypothetical protein
VTATRIRNTRNGAPTWSPQTTQENWSDRRGRGNFIKAWGVSSPCGPGRVMPKHYGARCGKIQRNERRISPRSVILDVCRIDIGPTRRDPRGTLSAETADQAAALQGASAMGSTVVYRRFTAHECQPSGVMPWSTSFDFGVCVETRSAHANRASARPSHEGHAYASNHRRVTFTRRCSLQNGLPVHSSAAHGVHG